MKFSYSSVTQSGESKSGTREAADKFELARDLKAQGETLLSAQEIKDKSFFKMTIPFLSGVKTHEKIVFARNLASMLEAGLPTSRALSVIERQSSNQAFKKIIVSLNDDIKKGKSLSEAMKKYSAIFSQIFISMTAAGEESGKLAGSLNVIASQMEQTYLLQKKIKGALIYPAIIIFVMLVIGVLMLIFIVPTLSATFSSLGTDLPASTQFIISLSEMFKTHGIELGAGILAFIVLIFVAARTTFGKRALDFAVLHIPIVSELVKESNSARTTRTLSSLLSAGVSVIDAFTITKDVLQNSYYKEVMDRAKHNVEIGAPVSDVFAKAEKLYPIFVGEMVIVGEETGDLGGMLLKVALFYETDVEQKTKDMSTVIEPFLMVIVGAAVGFFAISMISPIYSLADKI